MNTTTTNILEFPAQSELTPDQIANVKAIANGNRNEVIAAIKKGLKERSGKTWSVTGGSGTAYGWISICSQPKRRVGFGYMSEEDRAELGKLMGVGIHQQGHNVPASTEYYRVAIAQALYGTAGDFTAQPYWD